MNGAGATKYGNAVNGKSVSSNPKKVQNLQAMIFQQNNRTDSQNAAQLGMVINPNSARGSFMGTQNIRNQQQAVLNHHKQ